MRIIKAVKNSLAMCLVVFGTIGGGIFFNLLINSYPLIGFTFLLVVICFIGGFLIEWVNEDN